MPEPVPHSIPEPVAQVGNDFGRGVAVWTGITGVLEQSDVCFAVSQDMIASLIDGTIEPAGSCMDHTRHPPCACDMLTHMRRGLQKLRDRFRLRAEGPPTGHLPLEYTIPCIVSHMNRAYVSARREEDTGESCIDEE